MPKRNLWTLAKSLVAWSDGAVSLPVVLDRLLHDPRGQRFAVEVLREAKRQDALDARLAGDESKDYADEKNGGNGDDDGKVDHHASKIADMLVQATGGKFDRARALHFLLTTAHGNAMLQRLRTSKKESNMKNDSLEKIAADEGVLAIAKGMLSGGSSYSISEEKLTELITAEAVCDNPTLTPAQAFAKVFAADTVEAQILRRAVSVAKNAAWISDGVSGLQVAKNNDPTYAEAMRKRVEALGR